MLRSQLIISPPCFCLLVKISLFLLWKLFWFMDLKRVSPSTLASKFSFRSWLSLLFGRPYLGSHLLTFHYYILCWEVGFSSLWRHSVFNKNEWWTGRPGMLRFMGSQQVGHGWVTERNWTEYYLLILEISQVSTLWILSYLSLPPVSQLLLLWL